MPKVSICIPSYKPAFFKICLTSAIAQTFQDTEILVSDDCPTEDIKTICDQFPGFVKYSRNPNPGSQNNVIRLAEMASGEYIKFLLDDDVLSPFCVEHLLQALESTKSDNTTLAYSPRLYIDSNNMPIDKRNSCLIDKEDYGVKMVYDGDQVVKQIIYGVCNFIGEFTTVMFRKRDAFSEDNNFNLFDLDGVFYEGLGDVVAWINLSLKRSVVRVPGILSWFRLHDQSNSGSSSSDALWKAVSDWENLLYYAIKRKIFSKDELLECYKNIIQYYMQRVVVYKEEKQVEKAMKLMVVVKKLIKDRNDIVKAGRKDGFDSSVQS